MTAVEVTMAEASAQASGAAPLSATLWAENADMAERILAHGFVRGLADGSLQIQRFKGYVAQDAYFLEAFARAYAFCLANSTSREDLYGFADLIAGVLEELKLHRRYAERWQVDLSCVTPVAATNAYVDFLLETARRGDLGETLQQLVGTGRSLLLTSHDDDFVREFATRVVVLADGQVVEEGAPRQVLTAPQHEATRRLLDLRATPAG